MAAFSRVSVLYIIQYVSLFVRTTICGWLPKVCLETSLVDRTRSASGISVDDVRLFYSLPPPMTVFLKCRVEFGVRDVQTNYWYYTTV